MSQVAYKLRKSHISKPALSVPALLEVVLELVQSPYWKDDTLDLKLVDMSVTHPKTARVRIALAKTREALG